MQTDDNFPAGVLSCHDMSPSSTNSWNYIRSTVLSLHPLCLSVCLSVSLSLCVCLSLCCPVWRAGSGVVRIDLLHFLARCRTRRLNRALSVLSLSLDFLSVSAMLLTRAPFCTVLFVCSVSWLFVLGCQYQCK